jgi:hypothetical protein
MFFRSLLLMHAAHHLYHVPPAYNALEGGPTCRAARTVFHQGDCGACAAFASASSLGMRLCRTEDFLPSPFRLFDCVSTCGNGSTLRQTGDALAQGIPDVDASPQAFGVGCEYAPARALVMYGYIVGGFDSAMKLDLMLFGPAVVVLHAGDDFSLYTGDTVYHHDNHHRDPNSAHSMVVVGWGSDPEPHWVVQNSWGGRWGDRGMARIALPTFTHLYAWRTREEVALEVAVLVAYFALLLVAVVALAVWLPREVEGGGRAPFWCREVELW